MAEEAVEEALEETEESDNDIEAQLGYYTRSKRRRLDDDQEECTSAATDSPTRKRKHPISYVPIEVLQAVFKYISYHELSQNVRLVNRRFKIIAEDMLNCEFKQIEKRINLFLKNVEISLGYTSDHKEFRCLTKLLNMLEILKTHYKVVVATVWRYVFNDYYQVERTCMYGGELIDVIRQFFQKFVVHPELLYGPAVEHDWNLPSEIIKVCQLAKQFCIHFDKVNEETQPDVITNSGCKIVDIIDAAQFAEKRICEKRENGNFIGQYNYFLPNSWLVAVPTISTKAMTIKLKQRTMHMRLRRIIWAHNEMYLQQFQYDREIGLGPEAADDFVLKRPGNNIYTGYGEVENTFFYYGVMNDGAYTSKFEQSDDNDDEDNEQEIDVEENEIEPNRLNSDEDILYTIPRLGLSITVYVTCHPAYAPLRYLNSLDEETRRKLKRMTRSTEIPRHQIKTVFKCEGASYARLPTYFSYTI